LAAWPTWSVTSSALAPPRDAGGTESAASTWAGPSRLTDPQKRAEARRRRAEGATLAELARSYDVSKGTISRRTA